MPVYMLYLNQLYQAKTNASKLLDQDSVEQVHFLDAKLQLQQVEDFSTTYDYELAITF